MCICTVYVKVYECTVLQEGDGVHWCSLVSGVFVTNPKAQNLFLKTYFVNNPQIAVIHCKLKNK